MSLKDIKAGKYQTYGAGLMDFCYTELLTRVGVTEREIAFKAVPNEENQAAWSEINDIKDQWDTSAFNSVQYSKFTPASFHEGRPYRNPLTHHGGHPGLDCLGRRRTLTKPFTRCGRCQRATC